jgi:hypothetical protein
MDKTYLKFTQDDLRLLELPTKEQLIKVRDEYYNTLTFVYASRIILRKEISPAGLYLYLLARFGDPNGIMSEFRKYDNQAAQSILWHYTLAWKARLIHIVCHNFRIDIFFSPGQEVDITPEQFALLVNQGLSRHRKEVDVARKSVERYKSFLNPLSHFIDSIDRMIQKAENLDKSLVKNKAQPETLEDIRWHIENHEQHAIAASELAGYCLSIRMMSPVAAEMFVNLLIYNLYKDIGNRKQSIDDFSRSSIITRVRELAQKCDGFKSSPDGEAQPFKDFLTLMNRRNDLLHGNIKPESRTEDDFQVHNNIPTILKFRSMFDRALGPTLNAFPIEEAKRDRDITINFIQYILSCLDENTRTEIEPMLTSIDLHYNVRDKRLIVLQDNVFVDSIDPELLNGEGPLPDWLK